MKYAKSIYRGGAIVAADLCDYDSARTLGLVCPFCQEAVFLRSGSFHERRGKSVIVPDSFAHYKSGNPLGDDCELRSQRKDGQEYLQQLEIQSRNQRLELYNKRMWDIIKKENGVTSLSKVKKEFGNRWIEEQVKFCRNELRQKMEFYQEEMRQQLSKQIEFYSQSHDPSGVFSEEIKNQFLAKISGFDRNLQEVICLEVLDFLSTRTAGYVLTNLFVLNLWQICATRWVVIRRQPSPVESIKAFSGWVKQNHNPQKYLIEIFITISQTDWIKLFNDLNSDVVE